MSADQLDKDLKKNSDWTYKWKKIFTPDLSKQAQEVVFSRKTNKISHPPTTFNAVPVACTPSLKYLALNLNEKLNFSQHINIKISKANKGIGIIKRLSHILPKRPLKLSTNLSLDHLLMLYMTNQTVKVFVPTLNDYGI